MEPEIVDFPGCTVCGLGLDCPDDDTSGIDALWDSFLARGSELPGHELYGVSISRADGFYYVAGALVPADTAPPAGMEAVNVPAGRYAREAFQGNPQLIAGAFERLCFTTLPAAGLAMADGAYCLEIYPADSWDAASNSMRLELCVQLA